MKKLKKAQDGDAVSAAKKQASDSAARPALKPGGKSPAAQKAINTAMIQAATEAKSVPKKKMGGMIKRADGSMSKRGLWDNIRANKGSGKKPTAAMLKQEKKIKANTKKK